MYDGEHVEDNDTPGSLNMEDSDTIEVVLERESACLPSLCSQEPHPASPMFNSDQPLFLFPITEVGGLR